MVRFSDAVLAFPGLAVVVEIAVRFLDDTDVAVPRQ